jgi:hypothetical protein
MHPGDKGSDNAPSPTTLDDPLSNVVGNYELRYEYLRQISRKQRLLCLHRPRGLMSPVNKGVSALYTLASRLQKQKAKLNPHMATCDFIDYFISPVLCDFHVSIL